MGALSQIGTWLESRRGAGWTLLCIVGLGVALQLFTLFVIIDPSNLFWPDPKNHCEIARGLASGEPFSSPDTLLNLKYSPGYPFALSLMMRVVGTGILRVRLFHVALFPLFLLSLFQLGRLWGGRKVGLVLAATSAVYPPFVYIPLTMYPEALLIYVFGAIGLLTYSLRDRRSLPGIALLGVAIAVAVLIRPTSVVWIPVAAGFLAWQRRRQFGRAFAVAAILFLIPAAVAGGWMARNQAVHGQFTFSITGASNLLSTFNENQTGREKIVVLPERIEQRYRAAETTSEKAEISKEEAFRFIRENPRRSLKIVVMQCLGIWSPIPQTHMKGGLAALRYKIVLAVPFVAFLVLGIVGVIMKRRDTYVRALVVLMVLNTVINGIFTVSVRHRVVTDFAFLLPAALVVAAGLWRDHRAASDATGRPLIASR